MGERKDFPPRFDRRDALWLGGLILIAVVGILIAWLG